MLCWRRWDQAEPKKVTDKAWWGCSRRQKTGFRGSQMTPYGTTTGEYIMVDLQSLLNMNSEGWAWGWADIRGAFAFFSQFCSSLTSTLNFFFNVKGWETLQSSWVYCIVSLGRRLWRAHSLWENPVTGWTGWVSIFFLHPGNQVSLSIQQKILCTHSVSAAWEQHIHMIREHTWAGS